jgi:hypothetical protein
VCLSHFSQGTEKWEKPKKLIMSKHLIQQYLMEPVFGAVAVLLVVFWSKLTVRRNRPFEPTLWFVVRWGFILVTLSGYVFATLDKILKLHKEYPGLCSLSILTLLIIFVTVAAWDWRRSSIRERSSASTIIMK